MAVSQQEWEVSFELLSETPIGEEAVEDLMIILDRFHPGATTLIGPEGLRVGTTVYVEAPTAQAALNTVAAKLPALPIVSVQIRTWAEAQKDLEEPNYPELLGVGELAELLEVSRQRASELAGQSTFPAPLARLKAGPVWDKSSIMGFLETWHRKAGRPTKSPVMITYRFYGGGEGKVEETDPAVIVGVEEISKALTSARKASSTSLERIKGPQK